MAPRLTTDASGRAKATLELPQRPTQYRVMAVAVDAKSGVGLAHGQIIAAQPVVLRPVLPSLVTVGDRFQAAAYVHNTSDKAISLKVKTFVAGKEKQAHSLRIEKGGKQRVSVELTAADRDELPVRFEAHTNHGSHDVSARISVRPRVRWERAISIGGVDQSRDIELELPPAVPRHSEVNLTVASHPFVGFEMSIETLVRAPYTGVRPLASAIVGLAAYARLTTGGRPTSIPPEELTARAKKKLDGLLALQRADGGFFDYPGGYDVAAGSETAIALHALSAARSSGWKVPDSAIEGAQEALKQSIRNGEFDAEGHGGTERLSFALRVLSDGQVREPSALAKLYDQRERLSPYALAQLAMAMGARRPSR